MSVIQNFLLATPEGYQISRSVRLRSSASAYFNRTPASAGDRRTWTFSAWTKRGTLGAFQGLMTTGNANDQTRIIFDSGDALSIFSRTATVAKLSVTTNAIFRDPSAWYHVVVSVDTTQATQANRVKIYINGVDTAYATTTAPALNLDTHFNLAAEHRIGRYESTNAFYVDGYLTEVNFIDGQALTPSSFGEFDTITGVWKPKKYTGTYGTNGFYLNFSDNSAATAAAIGKDYSGNGNNWTPNNISVTAGTTYDSMLDVPTNWADGGNGRGNYAVLNPLAAGTASYLNSGNLNASISATNTSVFGTFQMPTSGKWYWEYQVTTIGGGGAPMGGIATTSANSPAVFYRTSGNKIVDGSDSSYGASYTTTDTIGVAVDVDGGSVVFYKNNVSQGAITYASAGFFPALRSNAATDVFNINFGQRPFAFSPPSGFKALNTLNLPEPLIANGRRWMDVTTYTGTGTSQSIVNAGAFQPDLVWSKSRSAAESHRLFDAVRGATNALYSNLTNAESTEANSLTAFNASGFTLGSGAPNTNGVTYVGWQWKEGAQAGFDIVTYTGTGANRTVAHSLGVAPSMMIVKNRTTAGWNWPTWHKNLAATDYLLLNTTNDTRTLASVWNSTAPTSSVFSVGTNGGVNTNGDNFVAYLFSEVSQFSKAFSFTGNGSTDGVFVFTGFLPRLILLKRTDTTGNWIMWDTARNTYNVLGEELYPNLSNAAASATDLDVLSNGFKLRNSTAAFNASGGTYIGFAWAANPFKYSLGF